MDQMQKDKLCKMLDTEIDKISNMPSLTDVSLNNLYKLIDVKKDLLEIEEKEMELEGGMDGYSQRRGGYSRRGNSYAQGGGRGGNSNRYMMEDPYYGNSYDGGYSMTGDVHSHLEEAMRSARNDNEREAIRQAMSRLSM